MPRLKMIDVGLPYKKIMQGSKWIGRVYKNAQGTYTGQIGKAPNRLEATCPTERAAFEEVAARFFGQPSATALHQHNARVRAENRAARESVGGFVRRIGGRRRNRYASSLNDILDALLSGRGRLDRGEVGTAALNRAERAAEAEIRRMEQDNAEGELDEDAFVPPRRRH